MTTVAVLQSNYLPWKGYFDIIDRVDTFVFYDDVQYTKHDWRNRNRIQTTQGFQWLTVPVKSSLNQRICDVSLSHSHWQKKHWKTICQTYSNAPFFGEYADWFEEFYLGTEWQSLSDLNQSLIRYIADVCLKTTTQFLDSRDFTLAGRKSERLLQLLIQLNTERYVSGPSGRSYLDSRAFEQAGIEIEYVDYSLYRKYRPIHQPFAHQVSVIDLLFAVGPDSPGYIRERVPARPSP